MGQDREGEVEWDGLLVGRLSPHVASFNPTAALMLTLWPGKQRSEVRLLARSRTA